MTKIALRHSGRPIRSLISFSLTIIQITRTFPKVLIKHKFGILFTKSYENWFVFSSPKYSLNWLSRKNSFLERTLSCEARIVFLFSDVTEPTETVFMTMAFQYDKKVLVPLLLASDFDI